MQPDFMHPFEISQQEKKRPVFLTVLCVLGFVCCGTGFFYFASKLYQNFLMFYVMRNVDSSPFLPSYVDDRSQFLWPLLSSVFCILSEIISLFALLLIFKLKRTGLFLYLASESLSMIFLVVASVMPMSFFYGDWSSIAVVIVIVLGDIAFIILHILNYKHLK